MLFEQADEARDVGSPRALRDVRASEMIDHDRGWDRLEERNQFVEAVGLQIDHLCRQQVG